MDKASATGKWRWVFVDPVVMGEMVVIVVGYIGASMQSYYRQKRQDEKDRLERPNAYVTKGGTYKNRCCTGNQELWPCGLEKDGRSCTRRTKHHNANSTSKAHDYEWLFLDYCANCYYLSIRENERQFIRRQSHVYFVESVTCSIMY